MWCVGGFIASSAVWMVVCWHMRSYILIRCSAYIENESEGDASAHYDTSISRLLYTFHFHSVHQCVWWSFCKRFNVVFIESDSWSVKYAIWYQVDNKTIITLFHVSEERKRTSEKNTPKKYVKFCVVRAKMLSTWYFHFCIIKPSIAIKHIKIHNRIHKFTWFIRLIWFTSCTLRLFFFKATSQKTIAPWYEADSSAY